MWSMNVAKKWAIDINSIEEIKIKNGINYLDSLVRFILSTLSNLKELSSYYKKYKNEIENEFVINLAFENTILIE